MACCVARTDILDPLFEVFAECEPDSADMFVESDIERRKGLAFCCLLESPGEVPNANRKRR